MGSPSVVSRLQGLRPTRSRTYASATALPRSPQGSLPAWVGWPLTGRGSHPLDDIQGFMTYSSIPLDRPAWPHHATTPMGGRRVSRELAEDVGRCRGVHASRRPLRPFVPCSVLLQRLGSRARVRWVDLATRPIRTPCGSAASDRPRRPSPSTAPAPCGAHALSRYRGRSATPW